MKRSISFTEGKNGKIQKPSIEECEVLSALALAFISHCMCSLCWCVRQGSDKKKKVTELCFALSLSLPHTHIGHKRREQKNKQHDNTLELAIARKRKPLKHIFIVLSLSHTSTHNMLDIIQIQSCNILIVHSNETNVRLSVVVAAAVAC